ncbi:hypothetical protein UWK_01166 [Desulfocapsa sulfexigens DSM 10523]|uniref:Cytochrome c domain-containing protein n=1 Tax=Desulfocapsa sulfexigens (strain DSM 10523 / SB164P1) TaxID=1167006 RepID=M1ND94_DESSD|nr:hypothetical protein [Desulfocapsa sulfexigens]AGF77734.1 hypothetical protein UWK_01166 [Desulfocapsa sulfexigens DSM 10523]
MRYLTIVSLLALCFMLYVVPSVEARPGKRFDESTKMCRILNDGGQLDWESDHWGIGAAKFKEVCKSCHTRDNDKGAPFLYMESYGSKGWNNVFSQRRKKCARDGSWDVLSAAELQLVNDYLYRNANNTYDPNDADSCG